MNLRANDTYVRLCVRRLEKALLKDDYVKALGPYCTIDDLYRRLDLLPGPRPRFEGEQDLISFNAQIINHVLYELSWLIESGEQTDAQPAPRPPFNAEFVLHLLLRKEERESVIGDLVEYYGKVLARFNKRRADIWFYKQVAGSLWPLLRRAMVKIGAFVWVGRMLRRLIS